MAKRSALLSLSLGLWAFAPAAVALEFRAATEAATVLYDAPSLKAKPVVVVGREYPLEIVVNIEGWAKVRDAAGTLAWVEKRSLGERRAVMVKTPQAQVHAAAEASAAVVFRAEQNVLLEILEPPSAESAWVQVRHRDGVTGFVRLQQVWGF